MDYLLMPSPPFVAGLTLGVADAKATAVAKITIKQFLAIPLTGKVVAGPCMMTLPVCSLSCAGATLTHGRGSGKNRQRWR
jgi:hypothetical protein